LVAIEGSDHRPYFMVCKVFCLEIFDLDCCGNRYQSMSSGSIEHNMRNSETSIRSVPSTAAAARQSAKRSIDALVIQFRIERMARRIGWTATIIFALVLMLLIPWINKPLIRLFS
jgi:hypothetical protein